MSVNLEKRVNIDSVMVYMFLKKIMTPIVKTPAYKMGLVNNVGKMIREPETDEEKSALTILDKFIFKLRRLLGSRVSNLNNFLFVQTLNNDFYNKLIVKGSVEQRAEIKRIKKDVEKIAEDKSISKSDIITMLIQDDLKEK